MPVIPTLHEAPRLSDTYRPNAAGYLGYIDPGGHEAVQTHINREAIVWQPIALLYNRPVHCRNPCIYQHFLILERDFTERYGEYEARRGVRPPRDSHWRGAATPFRSLRAPHHYGFAPSRKLLMDNHTYCLRDILNDSGYRRSLDDTEETQQVTVFSAIDPVTPIGFFTFHRKVACAQRSIHLYLYPNFIYVAPPYRGLGYGISLVSAALEIWESELHYQAARYRGRCFMHVQIDADALTLDAGEPILRLLRVHTLAAMESCASYWGCELSPLQIQTSEGLKAHRLRSTSLR